MRRGRPVAFCLETLVYILLAHEEEHDDGEGVDVIEHLGRHPGRQVQCLSLEHDVGAELVAQHPVHRQRDEGNAEVQRLATVRDPQRRLRVRAQTALLFSLLLWGAVRRRRRHRPRGGRLAAAAHGVTGTTHRHVPGGGALVASAVRLLRPPLRAVQGVGKEVAAVGRDKLFVRDPAHEKQALVVDGAAEQTEKDKTGGRFVLRENGVGLPKHDRGRYHDKRGAKVAPVVARRQRGAAALNGACVQVAQQRPHEDAHQCAEVARPVGNAKQTLQRVLQVARGGGRGGGQPGAAVLHRPLVLAAAGIPVQHQCVARHAARLEVRRRVPGRDAVRHERVRAHLHPAVARAEGGEGDGEEDVREDVGVCGEGAEQKGEGRGEEEDQTRRIHVQRGQKDARAADGAVREPGGGARAQWDHDVHGVRDGVGAGVAGAQHVHAVRVEGEGHRVVGHALGKVNPHHNPNQFWKIKDQFLVRFASMLLFYVNALNVNIEKKR
ncbi:hypothetical protein STCU_08766 [Strigomonas culicis]|uniref:Uncharacterized protein n=1 Tax=Strigomonas culicis TaxID=28005 RepID=S9TWI6_9TRYP|nr:hypothetical protein STCU_08766 [Strigomonas culicis]|eukprot:EPY20944.1 hypothetical protein STCU_08766 [Strigomonas culicis]